MSLPPFPFLLPLMKIMGFRSVLRAMQWLNGFRFHMDDVILLLYDVLYEYKRCGGPEQAILFEEVWPDDDVGHTGFVLQTEKYDSFRGVGALPDDHHSGHLHVLAVAVRRRSSAVETPRARSSSRRYQSPRGLVFEAARGFSEDCPLAEAGWLAAVLIPWPCGASGGWLFAIRLVRNCG